MKTAPVGVAASTSEDDLAARAAWLHHAGGLTQSAVAKRLGLAPTRAHRLIARASRDGLVRVFVDCEVAECIALEERLCAAFGLVECHVVPDIGEGVGPPLAALAHGGSAYLLRLLESGAHPLIGVGHGRTLAGAVDALPRRGTPGQAWVSLLGGLTRKFAANPYDVIFRLAEKAGSEAYFMPAPMVADSVEDRELMLGQTGLRELMRHIDAATLWVLGIGSTEAGDPVALDAFGDQDDVLRRLRELGVVAELLGQFLDADGRRVSTPWDGRTMAPDLATLAGRDVVAIAGGAAKCGAIAAALRSGHLTGLITDEATASALVDTAL